MNYLDYFFQTIKQSTSNFYYYLFVVNIILSLDVFLHFIHATPIIRMNTYSRFFHETTPIHVILFFILFGFFYLVLRVISIFIILIMTYPKTNTSPSGLERFNVIFNDNKSKEELIEINKSLEKYIHLLGFLFLIYIDMLYKNSLIEFIYGFFVKHTTFQYVTINSFFVVSIYIVITQNLKTLSKINENSYRILSNIHLVNSFNKKIPVYKKKVIRVIVLLYKKKVIRSIVLFFIYLLILLLSMHIYK